MVQSQGIEEHKPPWWQQVDTISNEFNFTRFYFLLINLFKHTGHQTATTKQTIINPTSLLQQRKIIHTVTPDGKSMEHSTTIKQILPKNIDNSIGTHFLAASNNSTSTAVASESPKLMSNVNGLKSPPGQGLHLILFWKQYYSQKQYSNNFFP